MALFQLVIQVSGDTLEAYDRVENALFKEFVMSHAPFEGFADHVGSLCR